jgi:hypothetical protein
LGTASKLDWTTISLPCSLGKEASPLSYKPEMWQTKIQSPF